MENTLAIDTFEIREQDGLYSLNDLHKAAGGELRHRPVEFLRIEQTQSLIAEINSANLQSLNSNEEMQSANLQNSNAQIRAFKSSDVRSSKTIKGGDSRLFLFTVKGRNGGTYACRELVIAYAAWISAAFHLKVIQVFLAQHDQPKSAQALPVPPQPTLMGRRFLLTLDGAGQERITALAPSDCILNPNNISNLIRSGSSGLDRHQLADVAKACIEQLGGVHE